MASTKVSVAEARQNFARLIERAEHGNESPPAIGFEFRKSFDPDSTIVRVDPVDSLSDYANQGPVSDSMVFAHFRRSMRSEPLGERPETKTNDGRFWAPYSGSLVRIPWIRSAKTPRIRNIIPNNNRLELESSRDAD